MCEVSSSVHQFHSTSIPIKSTRSRNGRNGIRINAESTRYICHTFGPPVNATREKELGIHLSIGAKAEQIWQKHFLKNSFSLQAI